jgi:competence protein ComEC
MAAAVLLAWLLLRRLPARAGRLRHLRWLAVRDARLRLPPLLVVVSFALGAWQASTVNSGIGPGQVGALNEQGTFRLVGVISSPPDRREESTFVRVRMESAARLAADGTLSADQPVSGTLLVKIPGRVDWQYGDRLALEGRPTTPPADEEFSYRDALARKGIYSFLTYPRAQRLDTGAGNLLLAAIYRLRDLAYAKIYDLFPAPEAPLLAGILLGIESDLTPAFQRAFRDTGTAHIIAISGFNIALLAGLFFGLFQRFVSRWWAGGLAALAISLYTILVGAQPSVVRAAIMGSIALLGALLGRRSSGLAGLNTLAFTAALMCIGNPLLPQDASFQLSFGATLGLMLYAEPLQSGFQRLAAARVGQPFARRLAGPVGEYILFTLAAQFTTLPVIAYHFQRLSLSSLLANPLVLPVQPLLMIVSGLAVVTGLVFEPLGRLLAGLAWPFSAYSLRVVEGLARIPGGSVSLGVIDGQAAALLALLALSPFLFSLAPEALRKGILAQLRPAVWLVGGTLLAVIALRAAATRPDGRLHLSVLNQDGQAVALVQAPGGARLLVGSGPGGNRLSTALGRRLPLDHRLDSLLLNDCSEHGLDSLPTVLERIPVGQVWWACLPTEDRQGRYVSETLNNLSIPSQMLEPSRRLAASGVVLEVLAARPESAAVWLTWDHLRVLLPAGLSPAGMGARIQQPGVLVLDASDLRATAVREWEALGAQVVIVAAGPEMHTGLPARWLLLPPDGWAQVVSDGETLWVEKSQ